MCQAATAVARRDACRAASKRRDGRSSYSSPESEWLSAGEVSKIAEELVGQFAHKPTVRVIGVVSDVLPASTRADDNTSGFVFDGAIHLVRSGLGSRRA